MHQSVALMMERQAQELAGDEHIMTSVDTPIRPDAFELSDSEKIETIAENFREIMHTLGLDLNDDSLKGTPYRVAKMFVKEIFYGLDPKNRPRIAVFDNKYQYNKMLVEKNISYNSTCEHHFLPIVGKAHVGYISSGKVIGLSKINRIVDYYARRPQVQERMTRQILEGLKDALQSEDVIVITEATHLCVSSRGIQDKSSSTVTLEYSGQFNDETLRKEFHALVAAERVSL